MAGLKRRITDKLYARLCRDELESQTLRDYYRRNYRIDVGLYSYGCFDRWRIPPGTTIGRYCSFAKTARLMDANHPTDALSTHPFFYLAECGVISSDQVESRPALVEDDVWLGHNAIVTPGAGRIGRGAIVGAGAVVTKEVPRYAIVVGNPGRVIRYRFAPEVIEAIEHSQWWLRDRAELARAFRADEAALLRPRPDGLAAFSTHFAKTGG